MSDITFVPTRRGWLYVAVMIDLFSRRVVGWAMSERINERLVIDALQMALRQRRHQSLGYQSPVNYEGLAGVA